MEPQEVNRVNPIINGKVSVKFEYSDHKRVEPSIEFENSAGATAEVNFDNLTGASGLNTVVTADSAATDVAGIVADFNTLLAQLRAANIVK